jgi:hypothetical protein
MRIYWMFLEGELAERVGFYTALILKCFVTYKGLTKLSTSIFGPYLNMFNIAQTKSVGSEMISSPLIQHQSSLRSPHKAAA